MRVDSKKSERLAIKMLRVLTDCKTDEDVTDQIAACIRLTATAAAVGLKQGNAEDARLLAHHMVDLIEKFSPPSLN